MPTHYTINQKHNTIKVHETNKPVVNHVILNGHDIGNGWKRYMVQLEQGDTADNPASTKGPLYGPGFVVYDVAPSGITVREFDNAGQWYPNLLGSKEAEKLREIIRDARQVAQEEGCQAVYTALYEDPAISLGNF